MRKGYIAISTITGLWAKDETVRDILKTAMNSTDDGLNEPVKFEGTRLIEVTYPDDETDDDDITFYPDGSYKLMGNAKAVHFDGIEIYDFIEGA